MTNDDRQRAGGRGQFCDDTDAAEVDEKLKDQFCEPLDELDRELVAMADAIAEGGAEEQQVQRRRFRRATVEEGRLMAIFSHFSVLFGIPVFLVTMYQRDNAFALHHAKAAGIIFLACTTMLILALFNCAVFLPLVFVCYIPALIGIFRAAAGVEAGVAALGTIGERVFQWIRVKN